MNRQSRLKNFPVSFLSIVLGLAGFTVVLQKTEEMYHLHHAFSYIFAFISMVLLLIIAYVYILKIFKYPGDVWAEFNNPVKINFFPIIAKIILLSSIILLGYNMQTMSKVTWFAGSVLQLIFSLVILTLWMHKQHFEMKHISPALFIPIVGNILVPITGSVHFQHEVSWFFFSIGLILWIIFTTIVFNRIIFHDPLQDRLIPTFLILMAPSAIGFIAYVKLTGSIDVFAKLLYYFSLFMFFVFIVQVPYFSRIKFYLSSWAYSFPLDAFTIATIFMYQKTGIAFFGYLAVVELIILVLIIFYLSYRTLRGIARKEICVEE